MLRTLSDGDREVLARLQADEIAYVAEVIACGGATAMEDVRREVRAGYEQAFLDEYGDELAALGIEPLG